MPKRHKPTLMTIGEVAARVRHLAADPFALTERCRHWGKLGLIIPADRQAEGTGRHKLYDERAVYDAALLTVLADAGFEPGRHVAEAYFKPGRRLQIMEKMRWLLDAQHWARQARIFDWEQARARNKPLYLEVFLIPPGKYYIEVHNGTPKPIEEIAKRSKVDDPAKVRPTFSIRFDLGILFERVAKSVKAEKDGEEAAVA
jgi:hypothetical protein